MVLVPVLEPLSLRVPNGARGAVFGLGSGAAPPTGPPGSPLRAIFAPHMLQKCESSVLRAPHDWQNTIRGRIAVPAVARALPAWARSISTSAEPTVARAVPRLLAIALLAALTLPAAPTRADEGDTVYQRLAGDLVLSAGIGGGVAFLDRVGPDVTGTTTIELRARLLDTGGLVIAPEWRPEGDSRVVVAVDLRPLFLIRFLSNLQSGDRWVDLFVDSIGIDLGIAIGPLSDEVGIATALGLGFDVPLFVPNGVEGGIFLRIASRWVGALASDQLAPPGGVQDVNVIAVLTVRGLADLGIARWEPQRYEPPEDLD